MNKEGTLIQFDDFFTGEKRIGYLKKDNYFWGNYKVEYDNCLLSINILKNMENIVSRKEYFEITGCSGGFKIPDFTVEEVQQYLINLGYKIIIHESMSTVQIIEMEAGGEVSKRGTTEDVRQRILAIKENDVLPDRVDSEEAKELDFHTVFNKEIKKQLLNF